MKKQQYTTIILSIVAIVACETDSDIILNSQPSYVLNSFIYTDSDIVVNAYQSVSYQDTNDFAYLGDANIALSVNGEIKSTKPLSSGHYSVKLPQCGITQGDTVTIEVLDTDYQMLCKGTTIILPSTPIDTITLFQQIVDTENALNVKVSLTDPSATTDYYQIMVRLHETTADGKSIIRTPECDFYDYLFYIARSTVSITSWGKSDGLFTDELINGRTARISLRIPEDELEPQYKDSNLKLEILLYRHTYDYYNYLLSAYMVREYLLLPVFGISSVYTNIDNGVGIVSGMSVSKYEIELNTNEQETNHIII